MLITAITVIGAGIGLFVGMTITGIAIGMMLLRQLPSKAKWDSVEPVGS